MNTELKYERHGKEYRKDDRESGDEDVYSTRHRLYEVECPECGSEDIEVIQWETAMNQSIKAVCSCGFEHREDYSYRDVLSKDEGEGPVEHVIYEIERDPERWWSDWEFSPRLFLDMIKNDGETQIRSRP